MNANLSLPRNIDNVMYAEFEKFHKRYPSMETPDPYGICTHCGHYRFEVQPNFGMCLVDGCDCDDMDPDRDEKATCEVQASWYDRGSLWTTLDDSYSMDREKSFARHAQCGNFAIIRLKRKYIDLALEFDAAISASKGWFEIRDGRASGVQRNLSDYAVHASFDGKRASLAMHVGPEHYELAVRYEHALRDGAEISLVHRMDESEAA